MPHLEITCQAIGAPHGADCDCVVAEVTVRQHTTQLMWHEVKEVLLASDLFEREEVDPCEECDRPLGTNAVGLCKVCADRRCLRCGGTDQAPEAPWLRCQACSARDLGAPTDVLIRLTCPWRVEWHTEGGTMRTKWAPTQARADEIAAGIRRPTTVSYLVQYGDWEAVRMPSSGDAIGD